MKQIRDASFEDAFELLYPRAAETALWLLGDPDAAEAVATEALARTLADWDTVRHLAHRDAWVLRVTTKLALDALPGRRLLAHRIALVDAAGASPRRVALWDALRKMPRRRRELVALRHIAGLTDDEIAHSLEISPRVVEATMARGMSELRTRLGKTDREVPIDLR